MTIQKAVQNHVQNNKMRLQISEAFLRRGIDLMSVETFSKKYDSFSISQFPNIGAIATRLIIEAIEKNK